MYALMCRKSHWWMSMAGSVRAWVCECVSGIFYSSDSCQHDGRVSDRKRTYVSSDKRSFFCSFSFPFFSFHVLPSTLSQCNVIHKHLWFCVCACVHVCVCTVMCVISQMCNVECCFFLTGEANSIVCEILLFEMVCEMQLLQTVCEMLLFQMVCVILLF